MPKQSGTKEENSGNPFFTSAIKIQEQPCSVANEERKECDILEMPLDSLENIKDDSDVKVGLVALDSFSQDVNLYFTNQKFTNTFIAQVT